MKTFSIVVTYNGERWIQKCLDSLVLSSLSNSIIVVDNASKDSTVSIVKHNYSNVRIVETGKNVGFGKANNIGIEIAIQQSADYVFLLNQDAWIENTTIEKLINASKQNDDFGIISPFHNNYDGSGIEKYFNDYVLAFYTSGYLKDFKNERVKQIYSSSFIHAACWLMPITTIKKIGGFDPLFFHYGEDNDYVQRLLRNNLKIGFVPNALFYHFGTNEGLNNIGQSFRFKVNEIALKFKNPNASLTGAILLFFRSSMKLIFASISKRDMKSISFEIKVFWFNLIRISSLLKSRKLQQNEFAYLQVNKN